MSPCVSQIGIVIAASLVFQSSAGVVSLTGLGIAAIGQITNWTDGS